MPTPPQLSTISGCGSAARSVGAAGTGGDRVGGGAHPVGEGVDLAIEARDLRAGAAEDAGAGHVGLVALDGAAAVHQHDLAFAHHLRLARAVRIGAGLAEEDPARVPHGGDQRPGIAQLFNSNNQMITSVANAVLDRKLRETMQVELKHLLREVGITAIFVTHDQEEALEVADRVVLMNRGQVEQVGTPQDVWDHPASPFVYGFLGDVNLFHGRTGAPGTVAHGPGGGAHEDVSYVRPHELEIVGDAGPDTWPVTLSQTLTVGPNTRVEFRRDGEGGYVDVELPRSEFQRLRERFALETGARVHLRPRRITRFAAAPADATLLEAGADPSVEMQPVSARTASSRRTARSRASTSASLSSCCR